MGHHIPISFDCTKSVASALWKIEKNSLLATGDIIKQRRSLSFKGKSLKQPWSAVRKVREEGHNRHAENV